MLGLVRGGEDIAAGCRSADPPTPAVFAGSAWDADRQLAYRLAGALAASTPAGAPALRCWPYGFDSPGLASPIHRYGVECVLPLVTVPAGEWSVDALAGELLPAKSRGEAVAALEAMLLAPGAERRADGLPAYAACGPDAGRAQWLAARGTREPDGATDHRGRAVAFREVTSYEVEQRGPITARFVTYAAHVEPPASYRPAKTGRNVGAPLRRVLATVARDVLDRSAHDVDRVYGLRPNRRGLYREGSDLARDSSRGRTMRREGRALLSALGAWPWALAPAGALPASWRTDALYVESLRSWCAEHAGGDAADRCTSALV